MIEFESLYQHINVPVLIYRDGASRGVVYGNRSVTSFLNPLAYMDASRSVMKDVPVNDLLIIPEDDFRLFSQVLEQKGGVSGFATKIRLPSGEIVPVSLSGNRMTLGGESYIKLCLGNYYADQVPQGHAQALSAALNVAYQAKAADSAIENVLSFIGHYMKVSRAYLYEAVSDTTVSMTYEWCAAGVRGQMEARRDLPRKQQPYDRIILNGLPVAEQEEAPGGGQKSTLSVPVFSSNGPLGYMGFDDLAQARMWTRDEVHLLQDLAEMLASLLIRRDGERSLHYSLEILNTVTNNFDNIVYVSDIHTGKILFANNGLSSVVRVNLDDLIGRDSVEVLEKFGRDPEKGHPVDEMVGPDGEILKEYHTWEFRSRVNGKWYLVRNAIIKWIDGKYVHIETATEITNQKEHEAQLEYVAYTDMMTGAYNREWGRKLIDQLLESRRTGQESSLVFLDVDDLKGVNDRFGHATGDQMIITLVEMIQSCIRKSDAVCRWGGDEFVIIIRADEENTVRVMEKIKQNVRDYNASGQSLFQLSFSYGVVGIRSDSDYDLESLITEADRRMYLQKPKRDRKKPRDLPI